MLTTLSLIRDVLKQHNKTLIRTVVISYLSGLAILIPVAYTKDVYGPVINSGSLNYLYTLTGILLFGYVLVFYLEHTKSYLISSLSTDIYTDLTCEIVKTIENSKNSSLNQDRLSLSQIDAIRNFIQSPAIAAFLEAPLIITYLCILYFIHPTIALTTTCTGILLLLILTYFSKRNKIKTESNNINQRLLLNFHNTLGKNFDNTQLINNKKSILKKLTELTEASNQTTKELLLSSFSTNSITKTTLSIQGSIVLIIGVLGFLSGHMGDNAYAIIVANIIGARTLQPLVQIVFNHQKIIDGFNVIKKIATEISTKKVEATDQPDILSPFTGNLDVKNISLITKEGVILKNINFSLKSGLTLTILGESGSGKSSLLKCLCGLLEPSRGQVKYDDAEIYLWKDEINKNISYQSQISEFLPSTVLETITHFQTENINYDELNNLLELFNLREIIDSLPNGINSHIENYSKKFSSGQLQGLSLARALYKKSKIILLDEPTNHIDGTTAIELMRYLEKLKKETQTTLIIVTHSSISLPLSDRVLLLKDGEPIIFGPTKKVMDHLAGKDVTTRTPDEI